MKAGANMKLAGKTVCVFVLLTIPVSLVTRTVEYNRVSVTVGDISVLPCPPSSNITLITWKISPKVGVPCTLGYRTDNKGTNGTKCHDNINWKSTPGEDPALEIRQVGTVHEGNYTCEVAATDGNFHKTYHLTVLGSAAPPRLVLHCDEHGNPVCQAVAGKPPAGISWAPESSSAPREEGHDNGTVTVLSTFTACSTNVTNATCIVSHPTGNQSKPITCHPAGNSSFILHVSIALCFLSIITFMAVIYYFKVHGDRLCHQTKPPETAPTHAPQDDTMEVEPYTTYVQKENAIYNSVSDLTVGQHLPQGLLPAT